MTRVSIPAHIHLGASVQHDGHGLCTVHRLDPQRHGLIVVLLLSNQAQKTVLWRDAVMRVVESDTKAAA